MNNEVEITPVQPIGGYIIPPSADIDTLRQEMQKEQYFINLAKYRADIEVQKFEMQLKLEREKLTFYRLLKAAPRAAYLVTLLLSLDMKSWKTSLFGILTGLAQIGKTVAPDSWHPLLDALTGVFAAAGLMMAKDSNVTGGTVVNNQ